MLRVLMVIAHLVFVVGLLTTPQAALAKFCMCITCALNPNLGSFYATGEAMAPAFGIGDCAVMNYIDPLEETVQYGDVIGFEKSPGQDVYIFRVIALAGDRVALENGQVILNGQPLPQTFIARDEFAIVPNSRRPACENNRNAHETCTRSRYRETAPNGVSYEILDIGPRVSDNTPEITVPPSHVFVLGDHRDNALDSRFRLERGGLGTIPNHQVLGIFPDL